MKITPAHDANDFAWARRAGLPPLVVMDEQGRMNDNVPAPYRGLWYGLLGETVVVVGLVEGAGGTPQLLYRAAAGRARVDC